MKRRKGLAWIVALAAIALFGTQALALTDEEIFRSFQFNFVNPGARAVGLGGAFIAAADDATAAQANPAALHYVNRMEFFAEYRATRPVTTFFAGARGNDTLPSPDLPFLDLRSVNASSDLESPSFVSFVYPFSAGNRRLRFALSRQVVLDVENSLGPKGSTSLKFAPETFPLWVNPVTLKSEQYVVTNDVEGALDAQIVHYNLGFSTTITPDFSLGVTATYATLDMNSRVTGTAHDPRNLLVFVNPRQDPDSDGLFSDVTQDTVIADTDSGFGYSVGVHWHPDLVFPSGASGVSPIRFGFVYRKGAELAVDESVFEDLVPVRNFQNVLKVPDRFGIGGSYETGGWTFALDVERIEYEDLLEGFRAKENFFTSKFSADTLGGTDGSDPVFTVDNATVVHAGVEYLFTSRGSWTESIRVGYFNAPDNRIRMTHFNSADPDINALFLDVFRGGEDDNHYTVGFSLGRTPLTGQSLTLQFAGDFSDAAEVYVGSLLWRFGRPR